MFWDVVHFLEIVGCFQGFLLQSVSCDQSSVCFVEIIFVTETRLFSAVVSVPWESWDGLLRLVGTVTISSSVWGTGAVPSSLFRWSLPDLWYFPHMYLLISTLLNTHGRPSLGPQSSLFVQLSSVWYYGLWTCAV